MMNPQKIMAPATEITNSMASLQKNIWEGGRKEGREGGWEEGREGGRVGGREKGREGREGQMESIYNKPIMFGLWCIIGNEHRCPHVPAAHQQ